MKFGLKMIRVCCRKDKRILLNFPLLIEFSPKKTKITQNFKGSSSSILSLKDGADSGHSWLVNASKNVISNQYALLRVRK